MENYQVDKVLGDGSYGVVYRATNKSTNETVAIKKLKRQFSNQNEFNSLSETNCHISLLNKHPNILQLKDLIYQEGQACYVFEYLDQNLYQFYKSYKDKGQKIPEKTIKKIIYQIICGLEHLHSQGYFHRDLKPENLLIKHQNMNVVLGDFGLAKSIQSSPPYTDYVSTRWYRAPEVLLKSQQYGTGIDIFALGCIMIELYLNEPIFPGKSEIDQLNKIVSVLGMPTNDIWYEGTILAAKIGYVFPMMAPKNLSSILPNASLQAIDLIQWMLQYDDKRRPSATLIKQHPFFSEYYQFTQEHTNNNNNNNQDIFPQSSQILQKMNQLYQSVFYIDNSPVTINESSITKDIQSLNLTKSENILYQKPNLTGWLQPISTSLQVADENNLTISSEIQQNITQANKIVNKQKTQSKFGHFYSTQPNILLLNSESPSKKFSISQQETFHQDIFQPEISTDDSTQFQLKKETATPTKESQVPLKFKTLHSKEKSKNKLLIPKMVKSHQTIIDSCNQISNQSSINTRQNSGLNQNYITHDDITVTNQICILTSSDLFQSKILQGNDECTQQNSTTPQFNNVVQQQQQSKLICNHNNNSNYQWITNNKYSQTVQTNETITPRNLSQSLLNKMNQITKQTTKGKTIPHVQYTTKKSTTTPIDSRSSSADDKKQPDILKRWQQYLN